MSFVRLTAVVLSLLVHASIGYTMLPSRERTTAEALDLGHGTDIVLVEQGVAMEGIAKLGNDMQTIETAEVVPVEQPPPPPPQEIKPDELRDVIASDASTVEQEVVKTQEPLPLVPPPPAPQVVQAKEQPEQVAALEQQSSGEARTGGDTKAFGQYLGQINEHVQKAKVNPRSRRSGTVVLRFTIGLNGQLLSKEIATSSGSKILDEAATAALDRAAPFPPIPPDVSIKPLAFTQPFKFLMR
jgi:periplasmic protein TonB